MWLKAAASTAPRRCVVCTTASCTDANDSQHQCLGTSAQPARLFSQPRQLLQPLPWCTSSTAHTLALANLTSQFMVTSLVSEPLFLSSIPTAGLPLSNTSLVQQAAAFTTYALPAVCLRDSSCMTELACLYVLHGMFCLSPRDLTPRQWLLEMSEPIAQFSHP